jgi:hypothetical protein
MVNRRSRGSLLHHLPIAFGQFATRGDLHGDELQARVPVHGIFDTDDRSRIYVDIGHHFEALRRDSRPGAVQRNRLSHARRQSKKRRFDWLNLVVGSLHADGVADLFP